MDGISNFEILDYMKNIIWFQGVWMKDAADLPSFGYYIINLNNSDQIGSHWCIVLNEDKFWYDPFGLPPIKRLNHYRYNTVQHQSVSSSLCGYYCMYFIIMRSKGFSIYDICYNLLKPNGQSAEMILSYFNLDTKSLVKL